MDNNRYLQHFVTTQNLRTWRLNILSFKCQHFRFDFKGVQSYVLFCLWSCILLEINCHIEIYFFLHYLINYLRQLSRRKLLYDMVPLPWDSTFIRHEIIGHVIPCFLGIFRPIPLTTSLNRGQISFLSPCPWY